MATQAGWEDFERLVRLTLQSKEAIKQLYNVLIAHIQDLDTIINDTPRRLAAKEIADIHPTYTVTFFQAARANFNTLKTWMEANGYGN
jgi:hypothetical protein